MVSRVDVIGLNPTKSFFTPIDLIPFLGGGMKIYKGGRFVVTGGLMVGRGSKAFITGKTTLKSGQVMSGGMVKLTGAVAAVHGAKFVRKGAPDLIVGVSAISLDLIAKKKMLAIGKKKSPPTTETQRIKSSRNVGSGKAQNKIPRKARRGLPKTIPRRGSRCPNGYRYSSSLNACVRK